MKGCLACGSPLETFLSFGRMPLANGFLREADFSKEYFFELKAGFCGRCALVQLAETVDRGRMFHGRYPFFTSSSARMTAHFERWGGRIAKNARGDAFIVEIGSNDGALLRPVAAAGLRHLGVDPSANVVRAALRRGVRSLRRFFDEGAAREIVRDHGQADTILAANCFCHIADLNSLGDGLRLLLKPRGSVIFEDPYLGDILSLVAYDQIYDEHAAYFSLTSVSRWLAPHGLEVVDVAPQTVHGGSMRYTVVHRGARPARPAVGALLRRERRRGLDRLETYARFRRDVERSRDALVALLRRLKRRGRRIAGYAATSKSTTVFNYCGITGDLVDYISDSTPLKQGRFSPGVHIPVRGPEEFRARPPEYAILLAWNHAREILEKEAGFCDAGGRWISYVPRVRVLRPAR